MIRTQQREAYQLLQEAGWRIVDDKMVDTTGKPVSIEFMLAQTDFERILLPFKRNLADLGIELVIRRVDVSQYVNRVRSRDFDMMVGSFPQSSSPGNEQREFWQSSSADKPGSRNYIGLKDPAIDELVEQLINADSRNSLVAHAKALDRVLQFGYYVIPNWHIKTYRVAYWNHLGHPKVPPRYDVGIATWLLLIIPTLFGILLINFVIIQAAPGGPVEQMIAKLEGFEGATSRIAGGGAEVSVAGSSYRGAQGLDPTLIKEIEKMYGFDKSAPERLWIMVKNYAQLDFGDSFFRDAKVIDLIKEKMPVSISLGLWSTLIMYLVSIPLGIAKATRHGSHFDVWTSSAIIVGYAIPAFLFAILLIVVFAGGSYFDWFPLRGLTSNNFDELNWGGKILDYFWHLALPVTALVIGNFATMTLLTKNSFLDEINKQYVVTAKAKGLTNQRVLYGHVFRNAMLLVIAGFPSAFIGIFFTGSLLVEVIFSLDGLGLMSFEAAINRDYPVVFGTLFIFTLLGLVVKLIGDLTYTFANKRGWWSLWLFLILFGASLGAELIANDKPLVVHYDNGWYFPALKRYPETTFGG
eukprot:gene34438-biopygen15348